MDKKLLILLTLLLTGCSSLTSMSYNMTNGGMVVTCTGGAARAVQVSDNVVIVTCMKEGK